MALPSRPARESPEEGYYSGLRSGSEVPTACPSQLFKVWQRGRVWYQWNADSLLVGLVPLASSEPLSPTLSVAFSSFTTCRMEELARRCFKGLSPFSLWQPWLCKCRAVTLATAPFQVTGGGDAVPDLCWRLHSVCLAGTFNSSNESLKWWDKKITASHKTSLLFEWNERKRGVRMIEG